MVKEIFSWIDNFLGYPRQQYKPILSLYNSSMDATFTLQLIAEQLQTVFTTVQLVSQRLEII